MSGEAKALSRLERSIRRRLDARAALDRVARSLPAIVQIVVGATAAYLLAQWLLGHELPLVAVTVTIVALGLARDATPRRVVETVIGINIGIAVAALLVQVIGQGAWQIAVILAVTLVVARAVSPSAPFAIAAAVQSMLVAVLPPPDGGVFARSLDGLIGGAMALLITAFIPRFDLVRQRGEATALFSLLEQSLSGLHESLRGGDGRAAELALARVRRSQVLIDDWGRSLESARGVAAVSPWLRSRRAGLADEVRLLAVADLTTRHVRAIARRVEVIVRDGRARPVLAELVESAAELVRLLGRSRDDEAARYAARAVAAVLAGRCSPTAVEGVGDQVVIVLLRPLVFDVLVHLGTPADEARALLPPL
ncbi:FUSC family protein [Microcella sp.]|uniref:FUSC family protein n=1 Tax=Microcella sp. TaxID=1913979 RepID=UPI00391875E5